MRLPDVLLCVAPAWRAVVGFIKLALEAGKATPAPPVGPALGAKGVNIMMFCKEYNAKTADKAGYIIPVEITVFDVRAEQQISSSMLEQAAMLLRVQTARRSESWSMYLGILL